MRRRRWMSGSVAAVLAVAVLAGCPAPVGTAPGSAYSVDPCRTDPALPCDPLAPHEVGVPQVPRGRLAVVLGGAGAPPQAYLKMRAALQSAGYHVIVLRYSSATGTLSACPPAASDADPECHRAVRSEVVFGAGVADPTGAGFDSPAVAVPGPSSILHRLLALVDSLRLADPDQGWGGYQRRGAEGDCEVSSAYGPCDLDWSKVSVLGHSLGAGVALYLSKFFAVARVGLLSGPVDTVAGPDGTLQAAPWIAEGGFATPASSMGGLQHRSESFIPMTAPVWSALGLVGPAVPVEEGEAPWGGAQELSTGVTPTCPWDQAQRHNSTAQDVCTPGSPPQLAAAWVTLAGG